MKGRALIQLAALSIPIIGIFAGCAKDKKCYTCEKNLPYPYSPIVMNGVCDETMLQYYVNSGYDCYEGSQGVSITGPTDAEHGLAKAEEDSEAAIDTGCGCPK